MKNEIEKLLDEIDKTNKNIIRLAKQNEKIAIAFGILITCYLLLVLWSTL